jgi:hypothetical protein
MKTALNVLYGDVVAGEVVSGEEFRRRLEAIESLEVGDDDPRLNSAHAIRAFDALESEAPSRHHQLELLREALGLA